MMFPKSIEKRNSSRLESLASASVLACLGTWVLARCLLDMSKGDHASFAVGLAFVLLLAWTSREILRDRKSQHHQLILLPASLLWAAWMAHRGKFSPAYHTPVEMVGLYWHFVDIVWIFLFPLLYLVDRAHQLG